MYHNFPFIYGFTLVSVKVQYDHILDVCLKRKELDKASFNEYVEDQRAKA